MRRLFFEGASPLRDEAATWFLRELRGRYDSVLEVIAKKQPCSHGELAAEYRDQAGDEKQLAAYLEVLIERYQMVEVAQPVFAKAGARRGRYSITDNYLSAWLVASTFSTSGTC